MKNLIRTSAVLLALGALTMFKANCQDVTTVDAVSEDISENLNLEAVASVFGESKNLEDFEKRLNDPEIQISNLDLNEDGYVDYLRVVETSEENTHLIAIQAVLEEDLYQDVATVEVEKNGQDETTVQVVGDVYLYGPSYIVSPVYVRTPLIFTWFWGPVYKPYRSVYYWGYYPRYFRYWQPFPTYRYRKNAHLHVNVHHTFHYTSKRYSKRAVNLHKKIRRNDFAIKHPNRSYAVRTRSVNTANGTKKRAVGVNKADGTKKRAAAVNKADGTKKRVVGVNQADGDKYRAAGVIKADGTKKRVVGVNKADGTKKRAATVKNTDGSRKTVAVKKNPDGSKRAVAVKKDANGSRTVKTAKKGSRGSKRTKSKGQSNSKKKSKATRKER